MAFSPFTPFGVSTARRAHQSYAKLPGSAKANPVLSQSQIIALMEAHKQHPSRSFLGDIKHGAKFGLNKVAWTFDKLERPAYAVANAYDKGIPINKSGHGGHIDLGAALHGAREGFMGREKTNFGAVLAHRHILDNHKILRGAAGLGADVVLDPLTYTGLGVVRKAGQETLELASKLSLSGGYQHTAENAAARAQKMLAAHHVLKEGGEHYLHRATLAKMTHEKLTQIASGTPLSGAARAEINIARKSAMAEAKLHDSKMLTVRFGSQAHHVKVPLTKLPKTRLGDANIKGLSRVAQGLGKAFRPGYEDSILHEQLLGRRHQGERIFGEYIKDIQARFGGLEKLSGKEQRAALHYFEKPPKGLKAVIKDRKTGEYILNPAHLARASTRLSPKQIEFVKAMHDVGQYLAKKHGEYGVAFDHIGAKGKLYVPHIVTKTGEGVSDANLATSLITKKGFQKGRLADYSIQELHGLHLQGAFKHTVETNPYTLMAIHARSVANKHADQNLVNYMTHAQGVTKRLVDQNALTAVKGRIAALGHAVSNHPQFDEVAHNKALQDLAGQHEVAAHQRYSDLLSANHAAIKHHLTVAPWQQTTQATVARISQRSLDAKATLSHEVAQIRAGKWKPLRKDQKPLHEAKANHYRALKQVEGKLSAAMKEQAALVKGTIKNPEYNADTMRKVGVLANEYGHAYHFPTEVADAIERLGKVMKEDDETLNAFANGYRKYLGKWKLAVTSVNPSYGTRNTLSDFWNMYLSGVPLHAMPHYGAKAAKLLVDAKKGDTNAVARLLDAYDAGLLSGLYAGDVAQVSNMLEHAHGKAALLKRGKGLKLASKIALDINRNRENWGRLTHFLYRTEGLGESAAHAGEKVKEAHFDYEDLTPFEQKRMKVVAPFYTWSRKNMPFQIKSLATSPGQYAAFPQALAEADSGNDGIVPSYMNQGMYAKIGGKFFNPMIGVSDLQNAANPMQLATSLVSPFIKAPVELAANKNLLTGQDIKPKDGYSRNPIRGGFAEELLKLLPGSNVGETGRKLPNGKMTHGPGADPRLLYLLGQTPGTNLLFNQGSKIKGEQMPENAHRASLAWLTGINATTVDQKQQQMFALLKFQKETLPQIMKDLRATGVIPPSTLKALSPNEQLIAEALQKSLRGGQ